MRKLLNEVSANVNFKNNTIEVINYFNRNEEPLHLSINEIEEKIQTEDCNGFLDYINQFKAERDLSCRVINMLNNKLYGQKIRSQYNSDIINFYYSAKRVIENPKIRGSLRMRKIWDINDTNSCVFISHFLEAIAEKTDYFKCKVTGGIFTQVRISNHKIDTQNNTQKTLSLVIDNEGATTSNSFFSTGNYEIIIPSDELTDIAGFVGRVARIITENYAVGFEDFTRHDPRLYNRLKNWLIYDDIVPNENDAIHFSYYPLRYQQVYGKPDLESFENSKSTYDDTDTDISKYGSPLPLDDIKYIGSDDTKHKRPRIGSTSKVDLNQFLNEVTQSILNELGIYK